MQSDFAGGSVVRMMFATVMMASATGCNDGNAVAGARGEKLPTQAKGAGKGNYVLVTELRPETPEKFFRFERGGYALCVAVAEAMNLPVKPFPTIPAEFVWERNTYASDGERTVNRKINFGLDVRKMQPERACELRLSSQRHISVVNGDEQHTVDEDEDGNMHMSTVTVTEEPVRASLVASYALPKRINGVPLKCDEAGNCIVDRDVVLVAHGRRPVQAAYRLEQPQTFGSVLVQEPVSLSVGKPVDPGLFSLTQQ